MNEKILNIREFNVHNINPSYENKNKEKQGGSKVVVIGKPGCFAKGTKVLMYNGEYKRVEDVEVDDVLMGDDSKPRNVTELCRNVDDMYKIIPKIGKSITVNQNHILSLISTKGSDKGGIIDIPLSKFQEIPEKTKQKYHWYRTSVEYKEKNVFIDPYIYGFFLDGNFSFIKKQFIKLEFNVKDNVIDSLIDKYNEGIHNDFLVNSKYIRLSLLAGIIDSQSTYNNITRRFTIEPSNCTIAKQIIRLANSLGFYSSKIKNLKPNLLKKSITKVYTCYVYANTNNVIPSRIYKINYSKVLFNDLFTSEFKIEYDGRYQYYGFTVDDNHRFLLKDFSVVHNTGKCLEKDTPVLMYDGSIKMVQNVNEGDVLMGDDSTPRNVLSTCTGVDEMYEIQQNKGDNYTVNSPHILSLRCCGYHKTCKGTIVDIPVNEYNQKSDGWKSRFFGYKIGVEFEEKEIDFDPYLLGLWLGDGTKDKSQINTRDKEVIDYLKDYLPSIECSFSNKQKHKYKIEGVKFINVLENNNLLNNKHIPLNYKANTRENRLKLLAGIIDSDGNYDGRGCGFDIVQKSESLLNDILYLVRSLGFSAYKTQLKNSYYRCFVSGNVNEIPVKIKRKIPGQRQTNRNHLSTRINVVHKGKGNYYGFELDGNHRFLLGDFTVTHNTTLISSLLFHKRNIFPIGMVCSGTEDCNHFWERMFPSSFIYNSLNLDRIESFIKRQKIAKEYGLTNPWSVLLLDDCTDDPKIFNNPIFQGIFKNSRHWKMLFILALQYPSDIKPVLRSNIDYTFILREANARNRKILHENYAGVIPTFQMFNTIMDAITTDYTALVIDNTVQSNNLEDCVFFYKPKLPPEDFKIGANIFWDHHYARYDESHAKSIFK